MIQAVSKDTKGSSKMLETFTIGTSEELENQDCKYIIEQVMTVLRKRNIIQLLVSYDKDYPLFYENFWGSLKFKIKKLTIKSHQETLFMPIMKNLRQTLHYFKKLKLLNFDIIAIDNEELNSFTLLCLLKKLDISQSKFTLCVWDSYNFIPSKCRLRVFHYKMKNIQLTTKKCLKLYKEKKFKEIENNEHECNLWKNKYMLRMIAGSSLKDSLKRIYSEFSEEALYEKALEKRTKYDLDHINFIELSSKTTH